MFKRSKDDHDHKTYPQDRVLDPDKSMEKSWHYMVQNYYRNKWTQTGCDLWTTSTQDLAELFQSLFREEVRSGDINVATREELDCRAAQSCANCVIAATDVQISDLVWGRLVCIPLKPLPRDKSRDRRARELSLQQALVSPW